jgi:membrane protein DedA with SNARE-associated domain
VSLSRLLLVSAAASILAPGADGLLEAISSVEDRLSTYLALGASTILVSELAPIFGGLAAHEDQLRITLAATSLLYVAGRLKWDWLRRRFPGTRSAGTVALRIVRRNPARASFLVRFLFGARILLPMACGAANVPLRLYLPVSLLGSLAWTVTYVLVGLAFGEAAEQLLGSLAHVEKVFMIAGGVAAVLVGAWWWRRRARRAARRAGGAPIKNDVEQTLG